MVDENTKEVLINLSTLAEIKYIRGWLTIKQKRTMANVIIF